MFYSLVHSVLIHVLDKISEQTQNCKKEKDERAFNPFPNDKIQTLPNWKSLQMSISLMKMVESYPNG